MDDFITGLKLIDDTQVQIRDELSTLNQHMEDISIDLESISEYFKERINMYVKGERNGI